MFSQNSGGSTKDELVRRAAEERSKRQSEKVRNLAAVKIQVPVYALCPELTVKMIDTHYPAMDAQYHWKACNTQETEVLQSPFKK